jgi:hypothetical protein
MVKRAFARSAAGLSLLEVVVTVAIFGVFIIIVVTLTEELRRQTAFYPVNFMSHPEVNATLARMRRDVNDATFFYPEYATIKAVEPDVLWVDTITNAGTSEVVMWDFRTPGEVHRRTYNSAQEETKDWVARGMPLFTYKMGGPYGSEGVEVMAYDTSGKENVLVIDAIFVKRPHS